MTTAPLEMVERNDLQYLEQIIEKGVKTFIEVGEALAKIRDGRLYRESHDTFESYCRDRWGFTKSYANYMVSSAEAVKSLSPQTATIVATESQARELAKVPKERREEVIQRAQEATGGKITATAIQEAAKPEESEVEVVEPKKKPTSVPHCEQAGITKEAFQAGMYFGGAIRNFIKEMERFDPQLVAEGTEPNDREDLKQSISAIKRYLENLSQHLVKKEARESGKISLIHPSIDQLEKMLSENLSYLSEQYGEDQTETAVEWLLLGFAKKANLTESNDYHERIQLALRVLEGAFFSKREIKNALKKLPQVFEKRESDQ